MTRHTNQLLSLFFVSLSLLAVVSAACSASSPCGADAPCCSEYGYCGSGSYCLGGCSPLGSHSFTSCRPDPICVSGETDFTDLSRVLQNSTAYTGNVTGYDWILNTGTLVPDPNGQGVRLTLTENDQGTKISSTRYVHYGQIDMTLETSKWQGVVTAAITMSDVHDEIDWEFPGNNTSSGQTNYWFLGIANYSATEGQTVTINSDTSSNFHTYSFNWQEDSLQWLVDGNVVRTVNKDDTIVNGVAKYPTTPSRIEISIWPAGINGSAQGTIDWSGGMINWDDPDYVSNGYFYNTLQSVKVNCAETASSGNITGWSYTGNGTDGVPVVAETNASLLLNSAKPVYQSAPGVLVLLFTLLSIALLGCNI
ncbi:hypothetical protein M231_04315 [Tremella mesenterica]|uniref:GH16 domain-containing protein n=1 Tax=Tremella mesenterica TaxID=5217 RepID=A0A4Q1BL11_TREME|nr:uncharacterized protein TREMEDRAFT_42155 [Tremella mesenterica DSM 1558]EIW73038.1 hypothetical protein TREMEDRAFT_42155 [Tremella mesenterica DSM 1558]RXK38406.1 hypothetical protein M231_04315 [Tremella mesenterica]